MAFGDLLGGLASLGGSIWQTAEQERLLKESWGREDTAVQRRAADLKAAGINPLLAAGQAASSSGPVQIGNPLDEAANLPGQVMALQSARKNIAQTDADILRTKAEAEKTRLENVVTKGLLNNAGLEAASKGYTGSTEESGALLLGEKQLEKLKNDVGTSGAVFRGSLADASAKETYADSRARDLQRLKERGAVTFTDPQVQSLQDYTDLIKKRGFFPVLGSNVLRFLAGGASQQGKAALDAAAMAIK